MNPALLIKIDDFDNFKEVRSFPPENVRPELIVAVRKLDEREELEPFIRSIICDSNDTPHGPAEIADILSHRVTVNQKTGIAAFVLKGKSFPTVRPHHVSHQLYRLEKISGLRYAIFAASGVVLDAAKEEFCSISERLECQYTIFDANDLARLFIAYGFLCPRDGRKISAGRCKCGYSPTNRFLNLFQKTSLEQLNNSYRLGKRAGLVILPPGSGKTRIAAEGAKSIGSKCILYVAHVHEILEVAQSEFEAVFGNEQVTRHESRKTLNRPNKVNISTIQLLQNNLSDIAPDAFDFLIVDEFHHAAAKSYRQLISQVQPRFLLGLTATPFRGDRQDIVELCEQNVLAEFELRSGIETGILCPYHYFGCFDNVDYSKVGLSGSTYTIKDLEKALIVPERDLAIIEKWKHLAEGKPTIAFCCSHTHARRVADSFEEAGIRAEVYLSTTSKIERRHLIQRFQTGDLSVLCVVDIMNEGADLPFVECLLFLRPTESQRIFFQQLGRGLRQYVGKSHCTVIDFIGNFKNAYKIIDYQGLNPIEDQNLARSYKQAISLKEIFNLPIGCQVHFDDKVIDIFARQALSLQRANRHNIGQILIYQYEKLSRQLGHAPNKRELDRNTRLDSQFYIEVFGSWKNFESIVTVPTTAT